MDNQLGSAILDEIRGLRSDLAADVPAPQGVRKLVPVDDCDCCDGVIETSAVGVDRDVLTSEDMARDGYFTAVETTGNLPSRVLRWTPGTDRIFPTTNQMAAAAGTFRGAKAWDFTGLAKDGAHIFGIPVRLA